MQVTHPSIRDFLVETRRNNYVNSDYRKISDELDEILAAMKLDSFGKKQSNINDDDDHHRKSKKQK